jgi:hypothetical protein
VRIQKVKQILTENLVPESAPCGTVFITNDTQQVWLSVRSEEVLNLSDLLDGKHVLASKPAKHGRDGKDGVGTKGERGERGADGKDGSPGKDGVGHVGAVGPQGRSGKDCECKTAIAEQLIVRLEQKLAESNDTLATVRREFADLALIVKAIHGQNKQADEYVAYLRAKRSKQ